MPMEPEAKRPRFEPDMKRRLEMSAFAKACADGAKPGEASVACRGDRAFPVARSDTALV
eukprot:CAMPEP_0183442200 /NCGR_PEP_ID=MMETSP0370-20130417/87409_1 /TAXON_ID=268820 /ORGANISM="Peridinium aciculiferum, Strain PAER-2" /LENGTH=58 /DNA_ID=CAMNT_0025631739 /DNA_START=52 /DNA_END=224 /DNA_ORIENTATION=+